MNTEETLEFLNNALAADVDPHVEGDDPMQVMNAFFERTGLAPLALQVEANQSLAISMMTGKLLNHPTTETLEACWMSAFHYGWIAAEAMAFKRQHEGM